MQIGVFTNGKKSISAYFFCLNLTIFAIPEADKIYLRHNILSQPALNLFQFKGLYKKL